MKQNQIEEHYNKACQLALEEVEKRARAILRKKKNLNEFVMAMGTWHFNDRKGQVVHADYCSWADSLTDFIDEWDNFLKLRGVETLTGIGQYGYRERGINPHSPNPFALTAIPLPGWRWLYVSVPQSTQ